MTTPAQRIKERERITRNRTYVAARRAETVCAKCGAQPIEWHGEHHHVQPHRRLHKMASHTYTLQTIADEIARCTPLCRRCHMTEDGRLQRLLDERRNRQPTPTKPCQQCQRLYKPLRRGVCCTCYDHIYRHDRVRRRAKP